MIRYAMVLSSLAVAMTFAAPTTSFAQQKGPQKPKQSCQALCEKRWGAGGRSFGGCLSTCQRSRALKGQ